MGAVLPLTQRWREERSDRRVAVAAEWNEFRDFNARLLIPSAQLMNDLRTRGVTALVVGAVTLNDLFIQKRIQLLGPSLGADPFDVQRVRFNDPILARQLITQWTWRNIPGLQMQNEGRSVIISRRQGGFAALKDAEFGFDSAWIEQIRAAGLVPVLRLNDDPWLPEEHVQEWIAALPTGGPNLGVLFNSDELPGRMVNRPFWKAWLVDHGVTQFLPEFKPARAAWQMAYTLPAYTYRAHSIPAAELKDLKPKAQMARWDRAVEERSCRLLLARMAPTDSRESYFRGLANLNSLLKRHHWKVGFPSARLFWGPASALDPLARPMLALAVLCLVPYFALRGARGALPRWQSCFWRVFIGCLGGALIVAAIAQTPYTRIQIIPFRGVKLGFLCGWALTLFALYEWKELRWMLYQYVRRRDIFFAGLALAAIAYLVLRSGNAPAAFKIGWEQSVRDWLESALIVRPRFKEFAIGYPLLWVGCYLQALYRQRRIAWDARPLIWIGMIGPISTMNTFCHLHSPLLMEVLRSVNGVVLGALIGTAAIVALRRWVLSRPQISFPFADEDALFYQRTS